MRKVKLTYFKHSGKYYSEYESSVEMYHDWKITDEVLKMIQEGILPGLVQGAREFYVLVEPEDGVPQLVIGRGGEG